MYPVSVVATLVSRAQPRCRPQYGSGVRTEEHVLLLHLDAGGTAYTAELSVGFGPAAGVVAGKKALSFRVGEQLAVHADRQRIVGGKKPHIDLVGVKQVEPLTPRPQARWYDKDDTQ